MENPFLIVVGQNRRHQKSPPWRAIGRQAAVVFASADGCNCASSTWGSGGESPDRQPIRLEMVEHQFVADMGDVEIVAEYVDWDNRHQW